MELCPEEMEQVPGVIHRPEVEEWEAPVPEREQAVTVYARAAALKYPIKGEFPVIILNAPSVETGW